MGQPIIQEHLNILERMVRSGSLVSDGRDKRVLMPNTKLTAGFNNNSSVLPEDSHCVVNVTNAMIRFIERKVDRENYILGCVGDEFHKESPAPQQDRLESVGQNNSIDPTNWNYYRYLHADDKMWIDLMLKLGRDLDDCI